jgi:hypothetical protein
MGGVGVLDQGWSGSYGKRVNALIAKRRAGRVKLTTFVPGPRGIARLTVHGRVGSRSVVVGRAVQSVNSERRLRLALKIRRAAREMLAGSSPVSLRTVLVFRTRSGEVIERVTERRIVQPPAALS